MDTDPIPPASAPDSRQYKAATLIQRQWRKRIKRQYLSPELRWRDVAGHTRMRLNRTAALEGKNTPRARWQRATFLAGKLKDTNNRNETGIPRHPDMLSKQLETQHWLELVDGKHRYGSNLKWYHRKWQQENTEENFFKWLDYGGGRSLSLDECPRDRLEKERITYLSAEQRLNYLVKVDTTGKLRWAKNGQLVDTTAGHWKDSGNGQGIIPEEISHRPTPATRGSFNSISSDTSSVQENQATHYVGTAQGRHAWTRAIKRHLTFHGIVERLLRKTVQRNTWIYVADKNYNIYIGIKETGTFQHSTFLSGGLVTSAGLISVKDGLIHTLSPLSGHYRTSVDHFHQFIDMMTERGVDMHKAKVSKAEVALWAIEHIGKWKKAQSKMVSSGKQEVKNAAHKVVDVMKGSSGSEDEAWKREILEGRKRQREREASSLHKRPSGSKSKQALDIEKNASSVPETSSK